MKRLMVMMTAAVVGACAWATDFSTSVKFTKTANRDAGQTTIAGYNDEGTATVADGATVNWWMTGWTASAEQPAVVSNDTGKAGESYLAIETETGVPLLRTFLPVAKEQEGTAEGTVTYSVDPVDIADHGIFVDTTVKFTGTDTAPTPDKDSKLLVWLKVEEADEAEKIEGSTNLWVTCGVKVGDDYVATNYVLNAEINPADYYRLTIRADKDTTDNVATFKIYLDENQLETIDGLKVFPSILAGADKLTLSYAGFEGTGFIKSVDLFTQSDGPSFAKDKTYLTISWTEGVTGFKLGTQDFNVAGLDYTSTNLVVAGGATEVTAVINTPTYKLDKFNSAGVSELTTSENTASFNVPAFAAEGVCTLQIVAVLDRAEASFTVNGTPVTDQGTLLSGILTYVNGLGECNDKVVITLGDKAKLGQIELKTLNNLGNFGGELTIDLHGCTVTGTVENATSKDALFAHACALTIKDTIGGGAMYAPVNAMLINNSTSLTIEKAEAGDEDIYSGLIKNDCYEDDEEPGTWITGYVTINGGKFTVKPTTGVAGHLDDGITIPDGKVWAEEGGYWVLSGSANVAKIGDTGYATLAAAFAAAKAGQTVTLISDVAAAVTNSNTESFTLDLNGETVSSDAATATIKQDAIGSTLTIVDSVGTGKVVNSVDAMDMGQAIWARQGNIVVNAGYFENASTYEATVYVGAKTAKDCGSTITINGGTFVNKAAYRWGTADTFGTLNVWNSFTDTSAIKVYGGSFSTDPAKGDDSLGGTFVASGYKSTLNGTTGLFDVTEDVAAVAKIGDKGYATFADAIAAVKDGEKITLVATSTNIVETEDTAIQVDNKGTFTLDLNSQTIAFTNVDAYYAMQLTGGTHMKIVDNSTEKKGQMLKIGNATFITIASGCAVTMESGSVVIDTKANANGSKGACFKNEGTLTINGGTLNCRLSGTTDWTFSPRSGSTTYVNGGTFIGPVENSRPGTVVITSECAAKFSETASYAGYIPTGYMLRKGTDDYYMVDEAVAATGATLNKAAVEIAPGATETLTATVAPETADVKTTVWASSAEAVAVVTNGTITAVAAGTANITVTITDYSGNEFSATCAVTVTAPAGPVVPEEQGTIDVDPNTGHATVTPANDTVTEIEVTGGENLTQVDIPTSVEKIKGVDESKVHITYTTGATGAPTYDITTAFTKSGDATEGVTYELNPDGAVEIDGENIPVTPTATEAASTEGTIADGAVATKSIPGLKYTLKRGTELGTYGTPADSEVATGTTVSLKDETGTKPADKAFYVIEVTK